VALKYLDNVRLLAVCSILDHVFPNRA